MRFVWALVAVAVLGGCDTVKETLNQPVSQLEQAKTLESEQRYAAIEAMNVTCRPRDQGCAQLRLIRANACRRLALEGKTQGLDCAVADYGAALDAVQARPDAQVDPATVRLALLEAIMARREASAGAAVARDNDLLLVQATAAQADPATRSAGLYYAANAELNAALRSPPPGGCDRITRAANDLERADTAGTTLEPNARILQRAIANARSSRGCLT